MNPSDPSQRKPSLMIAIAPKGGPEPPPRPIVRATGGRPSGPSPSNGAGGQPSNIPRTGISDADAGGKASAEEALVVRADKHCAQCGHYHADSGMCDKVDGTFQPDDACLRYFEPAGMGMEREHESIPGATPSSSSSMGMGTGAGTTADRSPLGLGS